ncbi:MAG: electron transport complex subunit E [Gammaproteobacteria bacterium]|nr:electron transport complex subunit E [Gammaproteobacteria bacterium]
MNQKIVSNGLWHNNPATVQLLGLCPLLAVTNTTINGFSLGMATLFVLICSNVAISLIRHLITDEIRIPVFVLVIASFVTATELLMEAYFYDLHKVLGIFIPLIVTNCAIIARAEAFASKNRPLPALVDGLSMGLGFAFVLTLLGGLRELLGQGTLLAQAHLMFGERLNWITINVVNDYQGFLLAILPPGAFIGLGLIIATKNAIELHTQKSPATKTNISTQ